MDELSDNIEMPRNPIPTANLSLKSALGTTYASPLATRAAGTIALLMLVVAHRASDCGGSILAVTGTG